MDALIASVKALKVSSSTDVSSATTTPFTFPLPSSQQSSLLPLLSAVNTSYATAFAPELKSVLSPEDKKMLLQFASKSLLEHAWPSSEQKQAENTSAIPECLNLCKILARTQTDLDDSLYTSDFIMYLIENIHKHSSASTPADALILGQSIRLLLNLCIVDKDHQRIHEILGVEKQRSVPLFGKMPKTQAKDGEAEKEYPKLLQLLQSLPLITNTPTEPDALFFFIRILMFVLIRPELTKYAIEKGQLYQVTMKTFLRESTEEKLGMKSGNSSSSSSSSSTSPSTTTTPSASVLSAIKLCHEFVKFLTNTSMLDDGLTERLMKKPDTVEETENYKMFLQRVAVILAYEVELPEEVLEGYKGDPEANAAVGTLMPTSAPVTAPTKEEEAAAETSTSSSTSTKAGSGASSTAPSTTTSDTAHFSTAPQDPPASFKPLQRQQTRLILSVLEKESKLSKTLGEGVSTFIDLKRDTSNLLLEANGIMMIPYLEQDGCRAMFGLVQLLHRSLLIATQQKNQAEQILSPIVSVLSNILQDDITPPLPNPTKLRQFVKRCIFLDLATPKPGQRKPDAQNYAMTPAGAVSEKIMDSDPISLKSLLLNWVITLNYNLKQSISEFLWRVVAKDTSEYIRLLGFGNAVGLLAEKGLPGFGMLKQQALNVDDVLKSGKKL